SPACPCLPCRFLLGRCPLLRCLRGLACRNRFPLGRRLDAAHRCGLEAFDLPLRWDANNLLVPEELPANLSGRGSDLTFDDSEQPSFVGRPENAGFDRCPELTRSGA